MSGSRTSGAGDSSGGRRLAVGVGLLALLGGTALLGPAPALAVAPAARATATTTTAATSPATATPGTAPAGDARVERPAVPRPADGPGVGVAPIGVPVQPARPAAAGAPPGKAAPVVPAAPLPARGTIQGTPHSKGTPVAGARRGRPLLVPAAPAGTRTAAPASPGGVSSSVAIDSLNDGCGFGTNEPNVAQSTDDPNTVVAVAQSYHAANGTCADAHAWIFTSKDGGGHYTGQIAPTLTLPASGDVLVTYDRRSHRFVMAFLEFDRSDGTRGRIGTIASTDGLNWGVGVTLDNNSSTVGVDKPAISVDLNPSSPHYGRVNVVWTRFLSTGSQYLNAFTDNGGSNWTYGNVQVNFPSNSCGNGTSASVDAAGELVVAWSDCTTTTSSGGDRILEEISPDGGATWPEANDTTVDTFTAIDNGGCILNGGGTSFRCNNFPTVAGDPTSGGGTTHGFAISYPKATSVTSGSTTATVSILFVTTTVNASVDATSWLRGTRLTFLEPGDKFFPASTFGSNGRFNAYFSNRSDSVTSTNAHGRAWDAWQTEAVNLAALRGSGGEFVSYQIDGTQSDPGSSQFIGDYSGITTLDLGQDSYSVWTDARNGVNTVRTQQLCYARCYSRLSPGAVSVFRASGSSFTDSYQFDTDPSYGGAGPGFWNAVGTRPGSDATVVDDDMALSGNRYFGTVASSSASPPLADFVLENGNRQAGQAWYVDVHSFSTRGGSYSLDWAPGSRILSSPVSDSMSSGSVIRVYDTFLNTGTTYAVGLRPTAGGTSSYRLSVHSAARGTTQGASSFAASSGNGNVGFPRFLTYATGTDASDWDAVTVQNLNSGSGSYTVYRDTAAPSGSVSIAGGASSTRSRSVSLSLPATNPTSGDPVYDMRIAVDGGSFGAYVPYASSANVTLSGCTGTHKVQVQYRNGAGLVSPTATDTITLLPATTTSAASAAVGDTVTVTGADFRSGESVKVYLDSTSSTPLKTVTASGCGFSTGVVVPRATNGAHSLVSVGQTSGTSASSPLAVRSSVRLAPASGPVATSVTATLDGFRSGQVVQLTWGPTAIALGSATADSKGHAVRAFTVPSGTTASTAGAKTVLATGSGGSPTATATFTVAARLVLTPTSGPRGRTVTAKLTGFKASQSVVLHWATASGTVLRTVTTDSKGVATGTFTVPTSSSTGAKTVFAVGSGGPTATATFTVT